MCTCSNKFKWPAFKSKELHNLNIQGKGNISGKSWWTYYCKVCSIWECGPQWFQVWAQKTSIYILACSKIIIISQIPILYSIFQVSNRGFTGDQCTVSAHKISRIKNKPTCDLKSPLSTIHMKITLYNKTRPTHNIN